MVDGSILTRIHETTTTVKVRRKIASNIVADNSFGGLAIFSSLPPSFYTSLYLYGGFREEWRSEKINLPTFFNQPYKSIFFLTFMCFFEFEFSFLYLQPIGQLLVTELTLPNAISL